MSPTTERSSALMHIGGRRRKRLMRSPTCTTQSTSWSQTIIRWLAASNLTLVQPGSFSAFRSMTSACRSARTSFTNIRAELSPAGDRHLRQSRAVGSCQSLVAPQRSALGGSGPERNPCSANLSFVDPVRKSCFYSLQKTATRSFDIAAFLPGQDGCNGRASNLLSP